jgi:hypothetical protein
MVTRMGAALTEYRIAPHRHPPLCGILMFASFSGFSSRRIDQSA